MKEEQLPVEELKKFSNLLTARQLSKKINWKPIGPRAEGLPAAIRFLRSGKKAKFKKDGISIFFDEEKGLLNLERKGSEQSYQISFYRLGIVLFRSLEDGHTLCLLNPQKRQEQNIDQVYAFLNSEVVKDLNQAEDPESFFTYNFSREQMILVISLLTGIASIYAIMQIFPEFVDWLMDLF